MNCRDCIYCNVDYIWDDEAQEEFETASCDKDRDEFENDGESCPRYTEYPPYKEQSTNCDKCYRLHECFKENRLIETTMHGDTFRHYIFGLDGCPKGGINHV